jgi:hypothetical protein
MVGSVNVQSTERAVVVPHIGGPRSPLVGVIVEHVGGDLLTRVGSLLTGWCFAPCPTYLLTSLRGQAIFMRLANGAALSECTSVLALRAAGLDLI